VIAARVLQSSTIAAWQKRNDESGCQSLETLATLRDCGKW
jgi:hypothetical protein